jgi:hypothetical protein
MNVPVVRAETKRIDAAARCYRETVLLSGDRLHNLDPTRALPTPTTQVPGQPVGEKRTGSPATETGVGRCDRVSAMPRPSWPFTFEPNPNNTPASVTTKLCASPAHTHVINSSFDKIQSTLALSLLTG